MPVPSPILGFAEAGACRDVKGQVPRTRLDSGSTLGLHHNWTFSTCHEKCTALGAKCEALDVDGPASLRSGKAPDPATPVGWCGIWGEHIDKADAGDWMFIDTGVGEKACHGDIAAGASNTCFVRSVACSGKPVA